MYRRRAAAESFSTQSGGLLRSFAADMDNSRKEAEAVALLAEAERKVKNSQSFFSGLFG